jgi:hypothetical protein
VGRSTPDLLGDSVPLYWDERGVSRRSMGLSWVQKRIAIGKRAPQRRTEGGTGRCGGGGGCIVKLRKGPKRRVCPGKGSWQCAAAARNENVCNESDRWYSTAFLSVTTSVALRPKSKPELHAQKRMVEAHGGRCVGVGGNIQYGEGRGRSPPRFELGKRAQCQGGANHAGDVCEATLERARAEEEAPHEAANRARPG